MFFLEVSLGQFMNVGGIGAWRICPILQGLFVLQRLRLSSRWSHMPQQLHIFMIIFFAGIGYATTIIVFCVNIYYNVILCWAFYYLFASFAKQLPWSHCNNDWNTELCLQLVTPFARKNHAQATSTLLCIIVLRVQTQRLSSTGCLFGQVDISSSVCFSERFRMALQFKMRRKLLILQWNTGSKLKFIFDHSRGSH